MNFTHDTAFYNTRSAGEIVPTIMDLLNPQSVLDVGCGIGTWLTVFKDFGVGDVFGIDGDYVNRDLLYQNLKESEFLAHDLTKPLHLNRKFDLVISLEVAEHIPEIFADIFIQTLTSMGNCVLFSAAVPHQDGEGHVNNQWPAYWQNKFKEYGFKIYDPLRLKIWSNKKIDWWYRQNMFLAIHSEVCLEIPESVSLPSLVSPELYELKIHKINELQKEIEYIHARSSSLRFATRAFLEAIKHRFLKFQ